MFMLGTSITIYILITLAIGYRASKRVKTTDDFTLAGRKLSTLLVGITIFATWFGPELVMGMPARFAEQGIQGIITDQFGTLLCLLLIARFYARRMYNLNLVTINDFFRLRFNKGIEATTSILNIAVYVAWIAAQQLALAIIFNSLFDIPVSWGILLGASIVVIYTYMGGMWAVSYTDLVQSILIVIGLLSVLILLWNKTDSVSSIMNGKSENFLDFFPAPDFQSWTDYLAMWMAFGVGAIASQDIFQRSLSAKSARSGANGVYLSGALLFIVGILPILLGLLSGHMHPELLKVNEGQNLIPDVVAIYAGTPLKILFFGALISAILSTSSGAMLAPASVIGENLIKPNFKSITDKQLLIFTRLSVVAVALLASGVAMMNSSIHDLVVLSAVFLMVSFFAPLTFGLFWKRASIAGAWAAIVSGALSYFTFYLIETNTEPYILATMISVCAMLVISILIPDISYERFTKEARSLEKATE